MLRVTNNPMNILLAIQKTMTVSGDQFLTPDYYNFYLGLKLIGHKVELFDYIRLHRELGKDAMNLIFLEKVVQLKPDIVFIVVHEEEFKPETIERIKNITTCIAFFHDDKWRKLYVKSWAPHFSHILCTDPDGVKRYLALGVNNAISFPQFINPEVYKSSKVNKDIDVSFVGAYHPYRAWLIEKIKKSGVDVKVFGPGWPKYGIFSVVRKKMVGITRKMGLSHRDMNHDMIYFSDMVHVFARSKINLNLSNSTSWDGRYLVSSPLAFWNTLRSKKYRDGIKLRGFEIGATGSFQLTYYEEGLERYYKIGEEIGIFINPDDLIDKIKYYLENEEEREMLAKRCYDRTIAEHTVVKRFEYVFNKLGLSHNSIKGNDI